MTRLEGKAIFGHDYHYRADREQISKFRERSDVELVVDVRGQEGVVFNLSLDKNKYTNGIKDLNTRIFQTLDQISDVAFSNS